MVMAYLFQFLKMIPKASHTQVPIKALRVDSLIGFPKGLITDAEMHIGEHFH